MSNFWTKPIFDMTILFPLTHCVKCRVTPSVLGITGNKSAYYNIDNQGMFIWCKLILAGPVPFLWWFFSILGKICSLTNSLLFWEKKNPKKRKIFPKNQNFVTIACKMKGCLRFLLPNLAKYTYGKSSLEQHWVVH